MIQSTHYEPFRPRLTNYIPHTPTVKQRAFLCLSNEEAFYGGAAGGGKSDALLMAALQYVDVPGYSAVIIRKTLADARKPSSILSRARTWLSNTDAVWVGAENSWYFPSGARLDFGKLGQVGDRESYQSAEYTFCVSKNTPIMMADSTWKPIQHIKVGEAVMTLEGIRIVRKVWNRGVKPVARVSTRYGSSLVSTQHRMLTPFGWASPGALMSIARQQDEPMLSVSQGLSQESYMHGGYSSLDHAREESLDRAYRYLDSLQEIGAWTEDDQNGFVESDDERRGSLPPQACFAPVVLHAQTPLLCQQGSAPESLRHVLPRGWSENVVPGFLGGYPTGHDSRDGLFPCSPESDLESTPSQGDAVACIDQRQLDGLEKILQDTHVRLETLRHPYTNRVLDISEACHLDLASVVPAGEAEVWDLTVDSASHYISSGNIIASNCGFDELTHFYEEDFDYVVMSRLRRTKCPKHDKGNFSDSCRTCAQYARLSQVPLRIRTASNPGGKGHIWVKRRYDIRKVPGMKTPNGRQLYAGQNRERPHIPAYVTDNPYIDKAEYMSQLMKMSDPVTREQLLSGDWGVSDEGRFKMEWVRRYETKDPYVELTGHGAFRQGELETFIIIDPAASKTSTPGTKEITKKIASHTVGAVFSLTPDGHMLVRHVERHQKEVPETKYMIRRLLKRFPDSQFVGMEFTTMSTHLYQVLSAEGLNMRAFKTGGRDKIARSVAATNEMESGRIWLPDTPSIWLQDFEDEIFTWTGDPDEVDDQIDVLSYAAMHKQTRAMNGYGLLTAEDIPCVI